VETYKGVVPARLDTKNYRTIFYQPLALIRILTDILPLNPSKVKIFGMDFFTGRSFYNSNYIGNNKNSDRFRREVFYMLSLDDPYMSFLFAKNMLSDSGIEMDDMVSRVLNYSPEQFLDVLADNLFYACGNILTA